MTEREIFFEALEMATPEARAAYLQGACGRDVTLRRKVDELLKEHFSNDSLLAGPALDETRPGIVESPVEEAPAQMIGRQDGPQLVRGEKGQENDNLDAEQQRQRSHQDPLVLANRRQVQEQDQRRENEADELEVEGELQA
jgi:hypothetical protein